MEDFIGIRNVFFFGNIDAPVPLRMAVQNLRNFKRYAGCLFYFPAIHFQCAVRTLCNSSDTEHSDFYCLHGAPL